MTIFAAVVEAESFTGAARRLGIAKSAVSRTVSDLERNLGTVLLSRTTRRVAPTEVGIRYYEGCVRMIAAAEEADGAVRDMRSEPSGSLRISVPEGIGIDHIVPAVARFAIDYPRLQVEVNVEDRFVRLVEEGIDLAVRSGVLEDSSLVARMLAPTTSVICASPEYISRRGIPKTPSDLTRHEWVRYTPFPSRFDFRKMGRKQSVTLHGRLSTNHGNAAISLVREGYGLTMAPIWIIHRDLTEGRLLTVLPDYEMRRTAIYALYPERRSMLPGMRLLLDYLIEVFKGLDFQTVDPRWIARG